MIFNVREKLISLIDDTVTLIWIHKGGSARDRIINIFIRRIQARERIFVESTRVYMKHNGFINCIASNRFSDLSRNKKKG